ncbi:non-ribosomal peptide synthetase [Chitinophaga sp. OAE865]|uniref:non-ribosomal peptide synthetase n=1 Tax=Chitinophaga sp. OAE865 TaxID=2817898 RepID=UPI001AE31A1C
MTIDKDNVEDIISLSPTQEGVLFQYLKNPAEDRYFERVSLDIRFACDVPGFTAAVEKITALNENLRCVFRWKALSQPVAIYLKKQTPDIFYKDLSGEGTLVTGFLEEMMQQDYSRGFDLEQVPYRFMLYKLGEEHFRLVLSYHHILLDGWSSGILLQELFACWMPQVPSVDNKLKRKGRFKNFVDRILNVDHAQSAGFWEGYLADADQVTRLPYRLEKNTISPETRKESFHLRREEVQDYCAEHSLTVANLMYGVWGYLLQMYNYADVAVFGTPVSGRLLSLNEFEYTVGLFINTVPICVKAQAESTIREYLQQLGKNLLIRSAYEMTPLREIKKIIKSENEEELFESILVIENYPVNEFLKGYQKVIDTSAISAISANHYDLTIEVSFMDGIQVDFIYNAARMDTEGVKQIALHFQNTLAYFLEHPDHQLKEMDIRSREEKDLLDQFNATAAPYPAHQTVIDLLEMQVLSDASRIAIMDGDVKLTYGELFERSGCVAAELRKRRIGANDVVALFSIRSVDFMIGVYGILRAGAAWLPIDPSHPLKRIEYMLSDSNAGILLVNKQQLDLAQQVSSSVLLLEDCVEPLAAAWEKPEGRDAAYIIYTSGSTGNPKGVIIEHGALMNRLWWMQKMYHLTSESVILNKTALSFDVSVWEVCWWAIAGASVCILPEKIHRDPLAMIDWIDRYSVTTIHFVPSMLNVFLEVVRIQKQQEKLKSLQIVFSSGEALNSETVNKFNHIFNSRRPRLVNLYGPTEATIDVSYYECSDLTYNGPVPIGKPIDNIRLEVVNRLMQPQPIGIAGELCIAGVGLARGYVNNKPLTDGKFVYRGERRIYRTGDLARYTADGNIIYLGRLDDQVKLRGYRIELSEIEQCLLKYPGIENAAVLLQEAANGDRYLCAYYTGKVRDDQELNTWLSGLLPEYSVPNVYYHRDAFPFNASGKLDRKTLRQPIVAPPKAKGSENNGPLSEKELLVMNICKSVFGVSGVNIQSSFIALGGDSIKAIQLQSRLAREQYFVDIGDILSASSLSNLCNYIILMDHQPLKEEPATGEALLTPVQQQFFETAFENQDLFLQGITLVSRCHFNREFVQEALHHLPCHHDALRTTFGNADGVISSFISPEVLPVKLRIVELNGNISNEQLLALTAGLRKEISIARNELFKVLLVSTEDADYLIMTAHHLIVDVLSWRILAEDFVLLYEQLKEGKKLQLGPKTSSVKKWSMELQNFAKRHDVLHSQKYWIRASEKEPHDTGRLSSKWNLYQCRAITISKEVTKGLLSGFCPGYKVNLSDLLIYALTRSYCELFGKQHMSIAMEGHGREKITSDIQLNRTVGWFTAIYPVRFDLTNDEAPVSGLLNVKNTLQQIPHKGLSYGVLKYLCDDPAVRRQLSQELPGVLFNYMGETDAVNINSSGISYFMHDDERLVAADNMVGFGLIVSGILRQQQLELKLNFDSTRYSLQEIDILSGKMAAHIDLLYNNYKGSSTTADMLAGFSDQELTVDELDKIKQLLG